MSTGFRARVLVAEDEEFTLSLLREVLEGANFQVEAVRSVAEAIERVSIFDPHAVITDLNFGVNEPSGADLLQHLDKEHPWVGKVVLTSHGSGPLIRAEAAEFNDLAAFDAAIKAFALQIRKIHERSKDYDRLTVRKMKTEI